MKEHSFTNATEKQANDLSNYLTDCVAQWCEANKCAGSTAEYNLYEAVQDAVRDQWDKARAQRDTAGMTTEQALAYLRGEIH